MKKYVWSAILFCIAFFGMKVYESHASINTADYILRGEPNTYYATFSTNADGTGTGSLQALPNGCSVDYILRGEPNAYYAIFSAMPNDIDSYNSEEMLSDDIVIAEPTPLPKQ